MRAYAFALILAVGLSGCAKATPQLVAAEDAVHDAIAKVDDEVHKVCVNPALAAPCKDVNQPMLELLGAGKAFNRAVANQSIAGLADVIVAGGKVADAVKALPNGETVALLKALGVALAEASRVVGR